MKAFHFFLKAIFLTLSMTTFNSCTTTELNEEIDINEQEKFQIEKEDIQIPGE
ncbi:hypothetical protein ACSTS3_10485 [Aquimarina muelleri]|uniref:hypothetical protein n=1 Tax=Aquimarina muelleri TaxID=279356 RepID=UPI003F687A71